MGVLHFGSTVNSTQIFKSEFLLTTARRGAATPECFENFQTKVNLNKYMSLVTRAPVDPCLFLMGTGLSSVVQWWKFLAGHKDNSDYIT